MLLGHADLSHAYRLHKVNLLTTYWIRFLDETRVSFCGTPLSLQLHVDLSVSFRNG